MSFSVGSCGGAVARRARGRLVEGGWPGALPKDTEFFARARTELELEHAQLVAFGSTRKAGASAATDPQVLALRDARTPVVCLVAKSDLRHVHQALRTTPEENLAMVADTVGFLVSEGRRVFLDCEHFFDGYAHDRDYGVRVLEAAFTAGASVGVLCDTNGGICRWASAGWSRVVERTGSGRHATQNDTAGEVANSLAAWTPATHVRAPPTATASGPATPTCSR